MDAAFIARATELFDKAINLNGETADVEAADIRASLDAIGKECDTLLEQKMLHLRIKKEVLKNYPSLNDYFSFGDYKDHEYAYLEVIMPLPALVKALGVLKRHDLVESLTAPEARLAIPDVKSTFTIIRDAIPHMGMDAESTAYALDCFTALGSVARAGGFSDMSDISGVVALHVDDFEHIFPPSSDEGWTAGMTNKGRLYYVDQQTGKKYWHHPLRQQADKEKEERKSNEEAICSGQPIFNLPKGWEARIMTDGRVYFVDHHQKKTQWTHPYMSTEHPL